MMVQSLYRDSLSQIFYSLGANGTQNCDDCGPLHQGTLIKGASLLRMCNCFCFRQKIMIFIFSLLRSAHVSSKWPKCFGIELPSTGTIIFFKPLKNPEVPNSSHGQFYENNPNLVLVEGLLGEGHS